MIANGWGRIKANPLADFQREIGPASPVGTVLGAARLRGFPLCGQWAFPTSLVCKVHWLTLGGSLVAHPLIGFEQTCL